MVFRSVILQNKTGLHARPASKFVETANKFSSEIMIKKENTTVNAKSIMGVMVLGANKGTEIIIEADGTDEEEAMEALVNLVESKFDEEE
ncbi:MAG TPA: phosphocarrier protein HPr [Eubacteriaceae bacterium]|nr:phosphocarrier protein HPr [Eubacteriaceae bacterium]